MEPRTVLSDRSQLTREPVAGSGDGGTGHGIGPGLVLSAHHVVERLASPMRPPASHGRQHGLMDGSPKAPSGGRVRGDHDHGGDDIYPAGELTPAAVLVALVEREAGLTVLLTQRQAHLKDHAGQISFPGGRLEPSDASEEAGALREAEEEIGLDPKLPTVVGRLDTYVTRTGFRVTPVVALVRPPFDLRLQVEEVSDAFEVPLSFVVDPTNHQLRSRVYMGRERQFFVLPYRNRFIWGATAGMLVNLSEVLRASD